MATATISVPKRVVEHAQRLAEGLGLSLEEYFVELVLQDLDPEDRAEEYIEAAKDLLEEAYRGLEKGNGGQGS